MAKIREKLEDFHPDPRLIDDRGMTDERKRRYRTFTDERGERIRDSPLNLASSRGQITDRQFAAGQKFYHHYFRAGIIEHFPVMNLDRVSGSVFGSSPTDDSDHHRSLIIKAFKTLNKRYIWILDWAVIREMPIVEAGYEMGHRNRAQAHTAGMVRFRDALDDLADCWSLG
jgi:hypothetical protein